ncbi:unnamed protein product [Rotaria sp. Silwood2]|nr:unnamed protein product [Rotaria sp. Silwood2]CAF4216095.1 unnamed protein product [Rotaria sp. Silwood2]
MYKSDYTKIDFCSTLQRTTNQLRGDKSSLERKLQDAQTELKAMNDNNKQIRSSSIHKSSSNHIDDDDDDNNNSNIEQTQSNNKYTFDDDHDNDDDDEGLSDTDSDVIQMKQTLNEYKYISSLSKPNISMNNINEKKNSKSLTVNLTNLPNNDVSSVIRNISFERRSNQSLIDSGQWTNTMLSTIGNNTYPLGMQNLHHYQPSISKANYWQSQPSLITRESVIKAARDVLPPGVIDRLYSKKH